MESVRILASSIVSSLSVAKADAPVEIWLAQYDEYHVCLWNPQLTA